MFVELHGCVESFSAAVADVVFGPVWIMAELVVLIQQLLISCRVMTCLALVDARVIAVVFLVYY